MEITLNLRRGSLKPEAIDNRLDQLDRMDDLLPDENSPRALYGTDSPVANRKPQISPKAKRPRRTAAVLFEDRIGVSGPRGGPVIVIHGETHNSCYS